MGMGYLVYGKFPVLAVDRNRQPRSPQWLINLLLVLVDMDKLCTAFTLCCLTHDGSELGDAVTHQSAGRCIHWAAMRWCSKWLCWVFIHLSSSDDFLEPIECCRL